MGTERSSGKGIRKDQVWERLPCLWQKEQAGQEHLSVKIQVGVRGNNPDVLNHGWHKEGEEQTTIYSSTWTRDLQIQLAGFWCQAKKLLPMLAVNIESLHRFKESLHRCMWRRGTLRITKYRKHIRLKNVSKLKIVGAQDITQGIKSSCPVPTLFWHSPVAGDEECWVSWALELYHEQPFWFSLKWINSLI